jgi:formylglycine-generating enzyme
MKARKLAVLAWVAAMLLATVGTATAAVMTMDTVPVGNAGNAADARTGAGAVAYAYNIGKCEVTAGQYTAFLNAIATTDAYGVFDIAMQNGLWGAKDGIVRSGSPGSYTYSCADDWASRPMSLVNWGQAARFANWLQKGQPTGAQDASTTEDGAYTLNGATSAAALAAVTRNAGWQWAICSEDEWYKAAYYDPGTATYFDYATSSSSAPNHNASDYTMANNANYIYPGVVGSPYYRTPVGAFTKSASPYGTFDQNGNVWEIIETQYPGAAYHIIRGGCYIDTADSLRYSLRNGWGYTDIDGTVGFRVSQIPEPATLGLLLLGGLAALRRRRAA